MRTIYGRPNSQHTQKVLWACAELRLEFDFVHTGRVTTGELDPNYRRLNPNGLVPTLVEDEFVLWESNTIIRYLAARYGAGAFIPGDPRERALGERWMDWQATTLNDAFRPVFRPFVEGPPQAREPAVLKPAVDKLNDTIAVLDRHLADRPYVVGESFTVCDIPVGVHAYRFFALPIARRSMPALEAWYGRLTERPAYRQYIMIGLS
ncbi:MAG TPA: glutathione S-transferase N-terminal domain-containing protein [Pseudolabrys sp.]|nr:glutathione S-transferase N-terminal domain-containing protein [Pseudolabrys sp.]